MVWGVSRGGFEPYLVIEGEIVLDELHLSGLDNGQNAVDVVGLGFLFVHGLPGLELATRRLPLSPLTSLAWSHWIFYTPR